MAIPDASGLFGFGGKRGGSGGRASTSNSVIDDFLNSLGGGGDSNPDSEIKSDDEKNPFIGDTSTFVNGYPVPGQIVGGLSPASAYGTTGTYYVQSDVYLPLSLSPDQIFQLQQALRRAGWLSGDIDHAGQWDEQSQGAFRDLLMYANQAGIDWRDALGQSLEAQQAGSGFGGGGSGGSGSGLATLPPLTIQLPNEDDVRRQMEEVAKGIIDQDPGEEFISSMTTQWMDHLRNMQLRDYEAQARGTRTVGAGADAMTQFSRAGRVEITEPESLEGFVQDTLEEKRPGLVRSSQIGDAEETFMDVMTRSYG